MSKLEPTRTYSNHTATEVLRRLLDERGVEWRGGLPTETIVTDPIDVLYVQRTDGMIHAYIRSYLTPEQAIVATLGSCNCSDNCTNGERTETCHEIEDEDTGFIVCSECGTAYYCWCCGRRIEQ